MSTKIEVNNQVWGISETPDRKLSLKCAIADCPCKGKINLNVIRGNKFGGQLPVYIGHSRDNQHNMSRLLRVGALVSETLQHTNKRLQINI